MSWFKNLRTVSKLMIVFTSMALVMAFVGYKGISAAQQINDMNTQLYVRDMLGLSSIKEANNYLLEIRVTVRTALLSQLMKSGLDMDAVMKNLDVHFAGLNEEMDKAQKTLVTEEGRNRMERIKLLLPGYQSTVYEAMRALRTGDVTLTWQKLVQAKATADEIDQTVDYVSKTKERLGRETDEQCTAIYNHARNMLIITIAISVIVFFVAGFTIAQMIARPLGETVKVLEKVAAGDLTARLEAHTTDEVGDMAKRLNEATESMRTALSEVRKSAESMASASAELASSSEELASGAQQQASSLQETTATLEELTSTVKQNADNAKQANQVASASRDTAEHGGEVVAHAVDAMSEINASSKSIVEIITAIDEIAFQTNLLALNAAVEAARAGEQGRGFAVVATEVRNLAQRSATSAKEIKRLIQDSVHKVENGSELVTKSGLTLTEIVSSVKKVTDIVAEIAAASREQSVGIDQVSKAMLQMDQVTQANSSQTEELSATAQSLSTHAQQLQALVERFRVDEQERREVAVTKARAPKIHKLAAAVGRMPKVIAAAVTPPVGAMELRSGESADRNAFQEF